MAIFMLLLRLLAILLCRFLLRLLVPIPFSGVACACCCSWSSHLLPPKEKKQVNLLAISLRLLFRSWTRAS